MFGATDTSAIRESAPPVVTATGAWVLPEVIVLNAALKRGSLSDAIAFLNGLKVNVVAQVLLASGFSIGASNNRAQLIASVQSDILAAVKLRMTGAELRALQIANLGLGVDAIRPLTNIRMGDTVRQDSYDYVVTGSIEGGISAERTVPNEFGITEVETVFLKGDQAIDAKIEAERFHLASVVPAVPASVRVTQEVAAQMQRGMRVVDGEGKEYEAFSARFQYLEVHPLDSDGKPVVYAGNSVVFHLDPATADNYPSHIYPPRRHDAIFLVDPQAIAKFKESAHNSQLNNALTAGSEKEQVHHGNIDQSENVFSGRVGQDRSDGTYGDIDRQSLGDGLAGTRDGIAEGSNLSGLSANSSGTGDRNPGERSESAPFGAARDIADVRNSASTASNGRVDHDVMPVADKDGHNDVNIDTALASLTVLLPVEVNNAIALALTAQKTRMMRLRTASKAEGLTLAQKLNTQTKASTAEAALRQMRQAIFVAEDDARTAIESNDISVFARHENMFPGVHAAVAAHIASLYASVEQVVASIAPLKAVPATVRDQVLWAIGRMNDVKSALDGVEKARGNGAILALEWQDQSPKLVRPREILAQFRKSAQEQGIDAERFLQELGGEPNFGTLELIAHAMPVTAQTQGTTDPLKTNAATLLEATAEHQSRPDVTSAPAPMLASLAPNVDYILTDADRIGMGGLAEKFQDNLRAIQVLRTIAAEKRHAVGDEKRDLARYVGWGGLKGVFDPDNKQWNRQHIALRELLSDKEWAAASRSQLDAFYTAPVVAAAMFSAVSRLGFNHGRILEPSVGVGNFFGLMPESMRQHSALHGVEMDILTSQIVSALYPSAKIAKATGFQSYNVPAGYFDMSIGNPPFGSQTISDEMGSAYSGWSIHNYFFAKSIDMLRPGGIMSMVVSHNFLDKLDPHVRQWIGRRAELISGVRLPNTAFKENANTEVVTDVLIFRRLDNENILGKQELPEWLDTTDVSIENPKTGEFESISINNYFINNPQNILGENSTTGSMYRANEYTVLPNGDLEAQLAEWVMTLPEGVYVPIERSVKDLDMAAITVPEFIKEGSFYIQDDGVWQRLPDAFGEQRAVKWEAANQRASERMVGMIQIRDALRGQMRLERSVDASNEVIEDGRRQLNSLYDSFQKKNGFVNDPINRRLFLDDTESALLQALEFDYEKAITPAKAEEYGIDTRPARAVKADIFARRVLFPPVEIEIVETAKDALLHSLNISGRVDMDYMRHAYDKEEDEIIAELGDLLFVDPVEGLVTSDEYLSGDVKTKLIEATKAAENNASLSRNVKALEQIIPVDKLPSEIHAAIGAAWIPAKVFEAFAKEISGADATYHYVTATAQWLEHTQTAVDYGKNHTEFGTVKMGALSILTHTMNSRGLEIKKKVSVDGSERYVTDEEATEAVRQRGDKVRAHWDSWLWADGDRADKLVAIYNNRFNRTVERYYDGSHLTFPGMSPLITLLGHQKNGVWRGLQDRVMLMDQVVGAGKTYEGVAMMMEMRRLGITKKPLIAVPNHLTLQWRSEFYRLYPGANVLAATPQDFEKENRERFFSKIVTGNWDAVIVGHSSLKKIAVPLEAEVKIVKEQFDDIADAIEDMKRDRGDRNVIRDMEKIKSNLESKLVRLREKGGKKDNVVDFGDLGVDALFIDEMHEFKNLFFTTQMNRVSGLGNPAGSGKAFDLFVKIRWLKETFGEHAPLITATGTPISNSLAEMFTMQRYMQYDQLKANGLHVFDAWAKQYGDVQNVYEVAPSGTGYRLSQRFAKFKNLSSLMGAYRSFADVITLDDLKAQEKALGKTFPVPKLVGGRPANIVAQRSILQEKFFGIPEIVRNEEGEIQFEINLSVPTQIVERDDGKFALEQIINDYPTLSKAYDSAEEAGYMAALGAITPKMTIDPHSIVGQFENLRELTRSTKGKINALSLTGLANKAGLDYRLISPSAEDFADSKVNQAVQRMLHTAKVWEADKGVQLVFCDLSVPLSAKAKMASKEKRLYVRDDNGNITHKKGTLHSLKEYEGLPYYLVMVGKGNGKTFSMYDPVSGQLIKDGFDSKQEAHAFVSKFIAKEGGQERWLDIRETCRTIESDEIDEYKNEHAIDADGDAADFEISVQDIEGVSGVSGFSIYDDMKAKLIAGGIPANHIEFIHDHDTPQAKDMLFKRVNAGDVRFLFGSTPKMGAGTNVQKRLVALHHIDAPWRPSDLEQREGRIIRRGNMFYERDPEGFHIEINRYATAQTYDTRRWQLLEHKASGLEQLRNYDGANEIDDVANEASNSADMKAAASGNPLILKETQLATEVKKLWLLERAHRDGDYITRSRMNNFRNYAEVFGPGAVSELQTWQVQRDSAQDLGIFNGKKLLDKEAVMAAVEVITIETALKDTKKALIYRGLKFEFKREMSGKYFSMQMPDKHETYMDQLSPSGVTTRMENWCNGIELKIENLKVRMVESAAESEKMARLLGKPFDQADALLTAIDEHGKVRRALMKSNSMAAVKPQEIEAFAMAVSKQKDMLRDLGLGNAIAEIEKEDHVDRVVKEVSVADMEKAVAKQVEFAVADPQATMQVSEDKNYFYVDGILGMKSDGTFTSEKRHWMTFTRQDALPIQEANSKPFGATQRGVFFGTVSGDRLKIAKPVTPQVPTKNMEEYIKVAAESIAQLRKVDVYRVLVESNRVEFRQAIASYIKSNRPDLISEVDDVLEETRTGESKVVSVIKNEVVEAVQDTNLSNITPEYDNVEVPFDTWFGNSKVVDGDGKALRVFHGTSGNFSEFEKSNGWYGQGIYFTDNAQWASEFAEESGLDNNGGDNVIPAYLSLQRPYIFKERLNDSASNVQLMRELDFSENEINRAINDDGDNADLIGNALKEMGHDGLIILSAEGRNEYVAFNPEQIKSALGNNHVLNEKILGKADAPRKGGTALTDNERRANSAAADAAELAMQLHDASTDIDFNPVEVLSAVTEWAKDRVYSENDLRQSLIIELEKRSQFRRKAGVLASLRGSLKDVKGEALPTTMKAEEPIKTAASSVNVTPTLLVDVPNEDWLAQERKNSLESGQRADSGVFMRMGTTTAYFERNQNVFVPVKILASLDGQRNEQNNVRQDDLKSLIECMGKTGRLPSLSTGGDYIPYIEVDQTGKPWINEGNHRIMAASALGWEYLPVRMRYCNGGEREPGALHPDLVSLFDGNARDAGVDCDNYRGWVNTTADRAVLSGHAKFPVAATNLCGLSGSQIEAMQGGKLKGAIDYPGVAPTQEQIAARKSIVALAKEKELSAVDAAASEDPRLAALRDAGTAAYPILQAAKALLEGDDSLVTDLLKIANIDVPTLLSQQAAAPNDIDHLKTRMVDALSVEVPAGWLVMNAPRPLLGSQTMNGEFVTGRFYAAIDPADSMAKAFMAENIKLDARLLVVVSRDTQMEMAMHGNAYRDQYLTLESSERYESLSASLSKFRDLTYGELSKAIIEAMGVVKEGVFSGQVLSVANGIVTQKVNRDGDAVRHSATQLSAAVNVGDVVDIQYRNGCGNVGGIGKRAVER